MDYSNLFLAKESIESVLKISQKPKTKSIGKGFASLVKSGAEKDAVQECNKCDHRTASYNNMFQHNRTKHSDIRHKCTECDYSHTYPSKVKTHHKQVHLGIPRPGIQLVCCKDICENVGKSACSEVSHFRNFCDQCEFSSQKGYDLKNHTMKVHEGVIELFSCDQCDFRTNIRASLKRHMSAKHIEKAMKETAVEKCNFEDCTYKTLFKYKLRTHIGIKHEGIVRFRCEFMNCSYGANHRKSFKEHTMTHSSEKNKYKSKCPICKKTFTRSRQKDRHIKYVHEGLFEI